ncbi:MAG: glucokinase [Desulfobacteraceae bacterium 4572_35.1]|nr:MAG: glucokinase [Desulfobacteraceae bacterium 4572_35.1]
MVFLAGDVGGTTSRFQWFDNEKDGLLSPVCCYPSDKFPTFVEMLKTLFYEHDLPAVSNACFGLPGPVTGSEVVLTNLPWSISACDLEKKLPISKVKMINDFQAAALGIDLLQQQDIVCLHQGDFDPNGNRLVIGAGTGLGVAPVYQLAGHFHPQASEGGHMDFAPVNSEQRELLQWFQRQRERVTYEDLLSGAGLKGIYQFCFNRQHGSSNSADLSAAQISSCAENGDTVAQAALKFFVNIYGEFVGNVALLWPARAGIYITGGIGAKIKSWMDNPDFTSYFLNKGNMGAVVGKMPVYLVLDEFLGLKGALFMCSKRALLDAASDITMSELSVCAI